MPDDIWALIDSGLAGVGKPSETLVPTTLPGSLDDQLDANMKELDRAFLPKMSAFKGDIGKVSISEPTSRAPYPDTIGPYRGDIAKLSAVPPGVTPEQIQGKAEALRQAELLGPASVIPRGLERFGAWAAGGASDTFSGLQQASEAIGRLTGLKPGDIFQKISDVMGKSSDFYHAMATGAPEAGDIHIPQLAEFALQASGKAYWDIGMITALGGGTQGMALYGGFNGWREAPEGKKLEGLTQGVVTGAAMGGMFHAIGQLPTMAQLPALFATGTGVGLAQGGTPQAAMEEGTVWAGLGLLGGNNRVTKEEFLSRYNEIGALKEAKAKRFLSQFYINDDGQVVLGPKDPLIRRNMADMRPLWTDEAIQEAGGAQKVVQRFGQALKAEFGRLEPQWQGIAELKNKQLELPYTGEAGMWVPPEEAKAPEKAAVAEGTIPGQGELDFLSRDVMGMLTNKPTGATIGGKNGQEQAGLNAGVGPGVDQGLHGENRSEPGRGDQAVLAGDVRKAGRLGGNLQATPQDYVAAFDSALANHPFRLQATRPDPESIANGIPLLSPDGKSGAVVTADGELAHVFNATDGSTPALERIIRQGTEMGGRWLNAFNTHITGAYGLMGYRPVAKIAFNPEYAPEGWDYNQYSRWNTGRPDVVFMTHDGVERSVRETQGLIRDLDYSADYDSAAQLAKTGGLPSFGVGGTEARGLTSHEQRMADIMRGTSREGVSPSRVTVDPSKTEVLPYAPEANAAPALAEAEPGIGGEKPYQPTAEEEYAASELFGYKKPRGRKSVAAGPAPDPFDQARMIDHMKTAILDRFYPVHRLVKVLDKMGIKPDVAKDPSLRVRLLSGLSGQAETRVFYKNFKIDDMAYVKWGGKSLKEIFAPWKHEMAQFDDYLIARRVNEIERRNATLQEKEKIDTGCDPQWARDYEAKHAAKYEAAAKEYTGFFHDMLDELADSGLVGKDLVAKWKAESPKYAPLRRDLDELTDQMDAGGHGSSKQVLDRVLSPIKKLRGSDLAVLPPSQSAVLMTYEITSAAERNRAAQAIIQLKDLSPDLASLIVKVKPRITMVRDISTGKDVPTIGKQDPDVVAVSFEGKREFYRVPQELADSMKLIHETGLSQMAKFLSGPARMLRTGATSAPEFAFRNPLRDQLTAFMNSKTGFNPIIDFPRGFWTMIKKPEEYWKWKAAGGEWSMLATMDRNFGEQAVKSMHRETDTGARAFKDKYVKTPLGYLEAISEAGEKPTRLGVFGRARRHGMSDLEAARESREASTDFAIHGGNQIARDVGATYTFLNARAQTTAKMWETFKEHPGLFAFKGFMAAGIPSIALYAMNRNDPEYWKRSEMERAAFWIIPKAVTDAIGLHTGGRAIKIPKGEIGVLFGTSIENFLQALDKQAAYKPDVEKFIMNFLQAVSPVGNIGEAMPTAARPIAEWIENKSFYYGTPLVSDTQEKMAPYLQYRPNTSETAKLIGKGLTAKEIPLGVMDKGMGASPAKIENLVRGYTGGVGRLTLKASDWVLEATGVTHHGPRPKDIINVPGVAGFVSGRGQGFESEPARAFYEMADKLDRYKATMKELGREVQRGENKTEELKQWLTNTSLEQYLVNNGLDHLWTKARTDLSELRKAENIVSENKGLTAEQKRKALDYLDAQVSEKVDALWTITNRLPAELKKNQPNTGFLTQPWK